MSLVAYGSSDESSDEEENSNSVGKVDHLIKKTRTVLNLPAPKDAVDPTSSSQSGMDNNRVEITKHSITVTVDPISFKNLPKPKHIDVVPTDLAEDEVSPVPNEKTIFQEKSTRKNRAPVKISLPSLSEFKDVEEEQEERKRNRIKPSENGTGLFSILPPPKGSSTKATIRSLIPDVVKKGLQPSRSVQSKQVKKLPVKTVSTISKSNPLAAINYASDSDEENSSTGDKYKVEEKVDFFSLANSARVSPSNDNPEEDVSSLSATRRTNSAMSSASNNGLKMYQNRISAISQVPEITDLKIGGETGESEFLANLEYGDDRNGVEIINKTLTSNVINLTKEDIIMKNKAEVGPKLPVPEQEYNVDSHGNVAFDEKAIEYLCGKRGVKRKNKDFDEANIIEINGEDIKPDEREWLVKALTEESAERPISVQSAGPSTQSRKKHQITYLAHQAKAMEVELKNQWAQNRVTRKQTQSKYGF